MNFMMILIPFCLASLFLGSSNTEKSEEYKPEYRPFKQGEFLRYNIHYGIVDAGEATFSVLDTMRKIKGNSHYAIKVTGRTYKSWDFFYLVRDYYYSHIDSASMLPTVYSRNVIEGDYKDKESYLFDHENEIAKGKNSLGESQVAIPFGVQDLASMLYFARTIRFYEKPEGFEIPLNVFFASEWFECSAMFDGYENIKTSLGTFRCMRIIPKLVEGRVFKGQDDMVVYVSADKNQVPIRIESEIFVGSIKVDLIEFRNLSYPFDCKIE